MSESKQKIERATNKAARAIAAVVDVFEEFGSEISEAQTKAVFQHLSNAVVSAHQKALLSRHVNGSFSLDIGAVPELPGPMVTLPAPIVPDQPPTHVTLPVVSMPAAHPTPAAPRRRAEGRLVGTKEPVFTLVEEEKPKPRRLEPDEVPDKTGAITGAGFIEE